MAILFAYHIRYVVDETILTYAGKHMRKFNFRHKNLNKITKKTDIIQQKIQPTQKKP